MGLVGIRGGSGMRFAYGPLELTPMARKSPSFGQLAMHFNIV